MDKSNEIILYQPNELTKIEGRLQDETVWLTQAQMAELFGTQRQAITKHLKNIFETGELQKVSTCSILELVQQEGLGKKWTAVMKMNDHDANEIIAHL